MHEAKRKLQGEILAVSFISALASSAEDKGLPCLPPPSLVGVVIHVLLGTPEGKTLLEKPGSSCWQSNELGTVDGEGSQGWISLSTVLH